MIVSRKFPLFLLLLAGLALPGCSLVQEISLNQKYRAAQSSFNEGNFALAATQYETLADRYPSSPRRQQLIINQAIALYTIGSYFDARLVFNRYLTEYPQGTYATDSVEYLKMIDTMLAPGGAVAQERLQAARNDLNELNKLLLEHPHDANVLYAIGNLYWEMGNPNEAVRYYYMARESDAAYHEKSLIKQRMIIDPQGKPVPQTPEEMERIARDKQPLVVFNTTDYKARDEGDFGGNQRFFVVTGLVRNQSSFLLHGVTVEATFYNKARQVMDTQIVRIGSVSPGSVRAFRVEAVSFDNLYNIDSYELRPMWEE